LLNPAVTSKYKPVWLFNKEELSKKNNNKLRI
jgi:hypothetical protein